MAQDKYILDHQNKLKKLRESVKDRKEEILKSIDIPLCLWDERLSTVGAFNLSRQLDVNISKLNFQLLLLQQM